MKASDRSILVFGVYLVLIGVVLLLVPNVLLRLFLFEPTGEPWIRVLGVVSTALGYYYIAAAKAHAVAFFTATIRGRVWVFLAFIGLVLTGFTKPMLILFGAVDLAGAVWTWSALRRESQA